MIINNLNIYLEPYKLSLDKKQLDQFREYKQLIISYNKRVNLTTITEPSEVVIKHFFDSLTPGFYLDFNNKKAIDIGAGAGLPGIPLKIMFPALKLTLFDSQRKRVTFLEEACKQLGLTDINMIHGRAEELAHKKIHREQYDIAIARAVARMNVLAELSLPFVRIGGDLVAMKGSQADEELCEAAAAIKLLGGKVRELYPLELPNQSGKRNIVVVNKQLKTPTAYPRKPGDPARKPLV